jgi:large subunit ribosomal protein L19e
MNNKKQLAARIMKLSPKKVKFAGDALEEIKKAITRSDIRGLIAIKKISKSTTNSHSRAGARTIRAQKNKGRQKGVGSRKGKKYSKVGRKEGWMARVRTQRKLLQNLRTGGVLSQKNFKLLYAKSKGGYFRSRRHIKLYITEQKLSEKKNGK